MKRVIDVEGTGGGFVFNAIKPEYNPSYLPKHTFAIDLHEVGGGWLDAPEQSPAGSVRAGRDDEYVFATSAYRS